MVRSVASRARASVANVVNLLQESLQTNGTRATLDSVTAQGINWTGGSGNAGISLGIGQFRDWYKPSDKLYFVIAGSGQPGAVLGLNIRFDSLSQPIVYSQEITVPNSGAYSFKAALDAPVDSATSAGFFRIVLYPGANDAGKKYSVTTLQLGVNADPTSYQPTGGSSGGTAQPQTSPTIGSGGLSIMGRNVPWVWIGGIAALAVVGYVILKKKKA